MSKKYIDKVTIGKNGVKIITPRIVLREKIGFVGLEPLLIERFGRPDVGFDGQARFQFEG